MTTRLLRRLAFTLPLLVIVSPCRAQSSEYVRNNLEQLSDSLQSVVAKISGAMVEVEVLGYTRSGEDEGDEDSPRSQHGARVLTRTRTLGSGVILDPDGYIITNAHVLEGARRVHVTLDEKLRKSHARLVGNRASATFDAQIIGTFEEADLALLKIDTHGLPTIGIADSDRIQPGQLVFAVGSPEGLKNSVSLGVVSAVGRVSESDRAATYIQTDAAINAGSSGGALLDVKGDLIGITSFMITEGGGSEGLGFALPSKFVYSIFRALKNTGHVDYGHIGIKVQNVTPFLANGLQLPQEWGVIVSDVDPGSPAAAAGLKTQDIVLTLDGNTLSTSTQFLAPFYNKRAGDHVELGLLRGSHSFTVDVPVVGPDRSSEGSPETANLEDGLVAKLGVMCVPLNSEAQPRASGLRSDSGVIVLAKLAGDVKTDLVAGDVIRSVNGTMVTSVDLLRSIIDKFGPGSAAILQIEHRSHFKYIVVEIN